MIKLADVLPQTSITTFKCAAPDNLDSARYPHALAFCDVAETLAMSAQPRE